jgi:hypothetical protein
MIKSDLVRIMNDEYARLLLEAARIEELPIELDQLQWAMEAANHRVDFDTDPYDFQAALLAVAAQARHD